MKAPEPTIILKYLSGLRLWSLCVLSVGLTAHLVAKGHITEAIYSGVVSAALYAFAGRDAIDKGVRNYSNGKIGAAEAEAAKPVEAPPSEPPV